MHSRNLWRSIRLPFQKLDTMMLNDIRLFLRDRKSLILVVLTPFLILSILINIYYFSDIAENIRGVSLGVCDLDDSDFNLESEIFKTSRFTARNCESRVAEMVSKGELRGAVVIPEGFEQDIKEGRGAELRLFIDNSKPTTALVASNAVKAYVTDLNERIGTEFILDAWKNLRELNDNLRFLVSNLEKAIPVAEDLKERLDSIRADIESVDFDSSQQTVSELVSFLNLLEIQLDQINSSYALTAPAIPELPQFNYTPDASIAIKEYRIESDFWRKKFCNTTTLIPLATKNPICTILDQTDSLVDSFESDVANISFYRDDINSRIDELNNRSAALNNKLEDLSALISSGSGQNAELKQDIENLRRDLLFMEEKTENMTKSIDELEQSLSQFLTDIVRVTKELNHTIEVLDTYTEKDPATILQPVKVDTMPVFKDKLQIFYKLPALISIILLFIILFISSSLIVNERRGGTMARIFLSPISMFFYVFEKMIYLLLLSLLAIISMMIAAFLFQVPVTISLNLILIFIVASLVYISIGILIGSISKSENTSLLTCLVIGFPLMFLSGAFSAPELMSQIMRAISQNLPLTMHIEMLESLIIYSTGLDLQGLAMMAGMILVFYVLSVIMIKKKPTLK